MAKYTPSFTIKQWGAADRPGEKLIQKGSDYLSNVELLAILIGSGNRGESAVQLMQRMMFPIWEQSLITSKVTHK